ncbi:hypothetical protein Mycsm_07307 (plasmid) [Mycobacterium sp. JS623]|uniref:hypothetical protein n=1 Tax=Mycobacterium sp. JS623 TaxID=212767 RepID=UPI0002A56985|nr:hypothetical protein [Mycobacterium sp. JS623]AGB27399.1 hypothetical protein Mycsm_07307 [Mycobacterium sp. JS623]
MTEQSRQYVIRGDDAVVEMWSGKRVQHGSDVRSDWQKSLKEALRDALSKLDTSHSTVLAGHYSSTTPVAARMGDAENSLYTNLAETIPRAFTTLRFERGHSSPKSPPTPIELPSGHLHYYRYSVGGTWTSWEPDRTLARWARVPRRIADGTDTARPVWFALREANARRLVSVAGDCALEEDARFGVRVTVHAAKNKSHIAITNSEYGIDGVIAAFHDDHLSDELVAAMLPKLRSVSEDELRRALGSVAGPVFPTAAVEVSAQGAVRINPADERCWVGEYSVRRDDSVGRYPEISGELFTIRSTTPGV